MKHKADTNALHNTLTSYLAVIDMDVWAYSMCKHAEMPTQAVAIPCKLTDDQEGRYSFNDSAVYSDILDVINFFCATCPS